MNNFLFICPLLSFLAIFLLASLSSMTNAYTWLRVLAGVILSFGLIISMYIFKIGNGAMIYKQISLPYWSWPLELYLAKESNLSSVSMSVALALAIFLIPRMRLAITLQMLALSFFLISIMGMIVNLALAFAVYSLGSVVIMYFSIINRDNVLAKSEINNLFLWHRASDLLIFIALALIFILQGDLSALLLPKTATQIKLVFIWLLLLGVYCRIIQTCSGEKQSIIENSYILIGAMLLLAKLKNIIFVHIDIDIFLLFPLLLIFFLTGLNALRDLNYLFNSLSTFVSCLIFSFLCLHYFYLADFLLFLLILLSPLPFLFPSRFITITPSQKEQPKTSAFIAKIKDYLPTPILFGAFYSNFMLYRLPQFVVNVFEIPLRIFHNGNIQRNLLFIIISAFSYYWFWR